MLVVSHAQGRYSTPKLPAGKYSIQGFGGTNESELSKPIDLPSAGQIRAGRDARCSAQTLHARKAHDRRCAWAKLMPEGEANRSLPCDACCATGSNA